MQLKMLHIVVLFPIISIKNFGLICLIHNFVWEPVHRILLVGSEACKSLRPFLEVAFGEMV